jgi:hypothetical protein
VTKIVHDQSKETKAYEPYTRIPWSTDLLPDQELLNKAIVACFKRLNDPEPSNLSLKPYSYSLILLLLQKITLLTINNNKDIESASSIEPFFDILEQYHKSAVEIPTKD